MGRKGDCWDNAVEESYLHTLKVELILGVFYNTRQKEKTAIFGYIEGFTVDNDAIPISFITAQQTSRRNAAY
jgi:hypothetical protein